jgi:NAD dependent epimerase/dehydratase family enzyme
VFALRLLFGEMSQVLLASQRVFPDAAQRAGFVFQHPDIYASLAAIARGA